MCFFIPTSFIIILRYFYIKQIQKKILGISICILSIFLVPIFFTSLNKHIIESSNGKKIYQDLDGYGLYYFTYIESIYISNINDVDLFENQNVKKNTL